MGEVERQEQGAEPTDAAAMVDQVGSEAAVHERFAARIDEVVAREESRSRHPAAGGEPVLRIDCADCTARCTAACDDCVVSFIVNREPGDALVVDVAEARAVRLLTDAGLLPGLRHQRRASGD